MDLILPKLIPIIIIIELTHTYDPHNNTGPYINYLRILISKWTFGKTDFFYYNDGYYTYLFIRNVEYGERPNIVLT